MLLHVDEVLVSLGGLIQTTDLFFHFPSHLLLIKNSEKPPFWQEEIIRDGDKVEPCSEGLTQGNEFPCRR